jgi:hypothetical protein
MREEDLQKVLDWRVKPDVAQFMLTEVAYDMVRQHRWFQRIDASPNDEYWIIESDRTPVGVLSLSEIDRANRHATWGLYLGEKMNSPVGGMIPVYFYNYVFARADLNLHKLHGKVLENNTSMLKMHETCGYRQVGIHKDHVMRDGKFMDVHVVELLRDIWLAQGNRFARHTAEFETRTAV